MKKILCFVIISFLVASLLSSCNAANDNGSATPLNTTISADTVTDAPTESVINDGSEITVESPMTLSNSMCTFNGEPAYLRLKMVKGRYYEDWNPGAYMGTLWEGNFVMELADEYGKTLAETDISKIYTEPLVFKHAFTLEFDDYNNDGDLDFTIGQYASSNGQIYRIFTLRKNGKVEELPVKDHSDLFISNRSGYYSTRLNKLDSSTFQTEYYNNAEGTFQDSYRWEDGQFVLVKSQKMTEAVKSPSLLDMDMINDTAGWAFNKNQVFHTDDGGQSWKDVTPEMTGLVRVGLSGHFTDAETGWVVLQEDGLSVGNQGAASTIVFYTSNAGLNWEKSVIPSYNIGTSMSFIDSNKDWILLNQDVGMGKQQGELFHTEDGGKTWLKVSDTSMENGLPVGGLKSGISFCNAVTGWLTGSTSMGAPILYKTSDGGKTWSDQLSSVGEFHLDASSESLQPVFFNEKDGILPISVYTGKPDNYDNIFYYTDNGGKRWEGLSSIHSKDRIGSSNFDFINLQSGWVITSEGILYSTGDGGKSWTQIWENASYKSFSCLDFVSEQIGLALADNRIVKTVDGGKSWSKVNAEFSE